MRNHTFIKILLLFISGLWFVIVFNQFFVPELIDLPLLEQYFTAVGSNICHQDPIKLIEFNSCVSVVCARCAGIYSGVFLGSVLIFFMWLKMKNSYLITALILMTLDVLLTNFTVYTYQKTIAFFTGTILGCIAFFYLYEAIVKLLHEFKSGQEN